jgi:hypothetical protein
MQLWHFFHLEGKMFNFPPPVYHLEMVRAPLGTQAVLGFLKRAPITDAFLSPLEWKEALDQAPAIVLNHETLARFSMRPVFLEEKGRGSELMTIGDIPGFKLDALQDATLAWIDRMIANNEVHVCENVALWLLSPLPLGSRPIRSINGCLLLR